VIESVYCAECGARVWQGDFEKVPPEIVGDDAERTPCPACGAIGRAHRRTISDSLTVTDSVTAKITRGISADRLGVLAVLLGVLLGVWALAGPLWATLSLIVLAVVLRLQWTRHLLMEGMHRITGQ
jgi:Flp pilus assembly protein TadB